MSHPRDILGKDVWSIVMDYMNEHPNQFKKAVFRRVKKRIHAFPEILKKIKKEKEEKSRPREVYVIFLIY